MFRSEKQVGIETFGQTIPFWNHHFHLREKKYVCFFLLLIFQLSGMFNVDVSRATVFWCAIELLLV